MRHRIQRIVREANVVDPRHHRMRPQKFRDLARVFYMTLHSQRHRLDSLQEQKAVKGRKSRPGVSLADGSTSRYKRSIPKMVDINDAVVCDLWPVEHVELFRILTPWELAPVDDHSADTAAGAADEFSHRMKDNIGAVLNRPQQNRRPDLLCATG